MLRKVLTCPPRTRPPRDRSAEVRDALTAVEARRIARASRLIQEAVALALRENRNPAMIGDPKKRVVDGLMQRWAVGHGNGQLPEDPALLIARPPALDDATQMVIDRIITHEVPETVRKLVCQWYRTETPCTVMAMQRGMSIRSLYRAWELDLAYLRELFLRSGHADLTRTVNTVGS